MALDPLQRRLEREAEAAKKAAQVPPLNPAFPFRPIAFDPLFFGLDEQPAEPPESVNG
ncbi:hypothetical protein ACXR0O_19220 [Verrucomicrobiota bacterium sgz303538]